MVVLCMRAEPGEARSHIYLLAVLTFVSSSTTFLYPVVEHGDKPIETFSRMLTPGGPAETTTAVLLTLTSVLFVLYFIAIEDRLAVLHAQYHTRQWVRFFAFVAALVGATALVLLILVNTDFGVWHYIVAALAIGLISVYLIITVETELFRHGQGVIGAILLIPIVAVVVMFAVAAFTLDEARAWTDVVGSGIALVTYPLIPALAIAASHKADETRVEMAPKIYTATDVAPPVEEVGRKNNNKGKAGDIYGIARMLATVPPSRT